MYRQKLIYSKVQFIIEFKDIKIEIVDHPNYDWFGYCRWIFRQYKKKFPS